MKLDAATFRLLLATRKMMLFSVGLVTIGVLLVFSVMIPQIQETISLYGKLQSEAPKAELLKKKISALESVTNTAEYAQIHVVDGALPSKKPLLELLTSIYSVSSQTQVNLEQFQLTPGLVASDSTVADKTRSTTNTRAYGSMELETKITGTFQNIQAFLLQIEKVAPFTTVTKMEIGGEVAGSTATDKETRLFQASLTTQTFFFTQPISVRVETPLPTLTAQDQNVLATLASFVPNALQGQSTIMGGGLEDLFGVSSLEEQEKKASQLEQLLQKPTEAKATQETGSAAAPTPAPAETQAPTTN